MNQLGISNCSDMINLPMECATYGKQKPERKRVGSGAPELNIPKLVLENHLEKGFKIKEIASMLSVSESIVYRTMQNYIYIYIYAATQATFAHLRCNIIY